MAGYRQAELAREAGIGRSYLNEIESGGKPGSPGVLRAIAAALKCPLAAIIEGPADAEPAEGAA